MEESKDCYIGILFPEDKKSGEEKGGKCLEKENIFFSGREEKQRRKKMELFGKDLSKNCQGCLEALVSVSRLLLIFGGFQFRFRRIQSRKKSLFWFRKIWSQKKKYLFGLGEFGRGKKSLFRFRKIHGWAVTLPSAIRPHEPLKPYIFWKPKMSAIQIRTKI